MKIDRERLVYGYQQWVHSLIELGYILYFISTHFHPLPIKRTSQTMLMHAEMTRIYALLLPRFVRRPMTGHSKNLPILIGLPDFPVPKHSRQSVKIVAKNGGLHMHALLLVAHDHHRMKERLDTHLRRNYGRYLAGSRYLSTLHATHIGTTPARAISYLFKSLSRGRVSDEEILILPQSRDDRITEKHRLLDQGLLENG